MTILLGLGTWQLMRGMEKAAIEEKFQSEAGTMDIDRAPVSWSSLDYHSARVSGQWLPGREFLLENRIYQGEPGYEVLVPYRLSGDNAVLLVNRGWMSLDAVERSGIAPASAESPTGVLYRPQTGFTLGDTVSGPRVWPQAVLYLDLPSLSQRLGMQLEPVVLVLEQGHPASFQPLWRPTSIPASRHYGYAAQWWGLGLTLLVFGVIWRRKVKPRSIQ